MRHKGNLVLFSNQSASRSHYPIGSSLTVKGGSISHFVFSSSSCSSSSSFSFSIGICNQSLVLIQELVTWWHPFEWLNNSAKELAFRHINDVE